MASRVGAAIDVRIEALIVAWARWRWPVLRLVPARWVRMAISPAVPRLRRAVLAPALLVGVLLLASVVLGAS
jgi:hypothetical protein